MVSAERKSVMSLDVLGGFGGSVEKLKQVVPHGMRIRYVEPIALGPARLLRTRLNLLSDAGFETAEIHGPTGADGQLSMRDEIKLAGIHMFMVSTGALIKQFSDQEILLHAPVVEVLNTTLLLQKHKPNYVWVENHFLGDDGVSAAVKAVKSLRTLGVSAGVMYDGVHHIGRRALVSQKEFPKAWDAMLSGLRKYSEFIFGTHVPVGTLVLDSYPMDRVSDAMLTEYAHSIPAHARTVTVENQQEGGLHFLSRRDTAEVQRRNGIIFNRLQNAGIVDFS